MNYQRFFLLLAETTDSEVPDVVLYVLIGLGVIAVIAVGMYLYYRVFRIKSLTKKVREIEQIFETSHGYLWGEMSTTIKRLESIQDVNLCYVDEYAQANRAYKNIRDVSDADAAAKISELKSMLEEKKVKELKERLPKSKDFIVAYSTMVNELKVALEEKFKIENTCKEMEAKVKAAVRQIRSFYNGNISDLKIVVNPLSMALGNLDRALENINLDIEGARYEEAKTTIENVARITESLNVVIKELPQMCIQLSSVLPDKIARIRNRHEHMVKEGYPLHQIITKSVIETYLSDIGKMTNAIQQLNVEGVNEGINMMHSNIDKANEAMDREIEARTAFIGEKDDVLKLLNTTQGSYITLHRDIDKIREIYALDASDDEKLDVIKDCIERLEQTKRTLDTLLNSSTKQPYSTMLERLHQLNEQALETKEAVDSFIKYLFSFKEDFSKATRTIHECYLKLKDAELTIHSTGMECIKAKYAESIDNGYSYINDLYALLQQAPIDIKVVNKVNNTLIDGCNRLIADLNQTISVMDQAERGILNANRDRSSKPEVDSYVTQAESLFFSGRFEDALAIIENLRFDSGMGSM